MQLSLVHMATNSKMQKKEASNLPNFPYRINTSILYLVTEQRMTKLNFIKNIHCFPSTHSHYSQDNQGVITRVRGLFSTLKEVGREKSLQPLWLGMEGKQGWVCLHWVKKSCPIMLPNIITQSINFVHTIGTSYSKLRTTALPKVGKLANTTHIHIACTSRHAKKPHQMPYTKCRLEEKTTPSLVFSITVQSNCQKTESFIKTTVLDSTCFEEHLQ